MAIDHEKALKVIEKSGLLNKNATLGQVLELAKELDNDLRSMDDYQLGSSLLYRCFLLHDSRE
ncbi:hypothetical protein ACX16B_28085 [Bacillus cereus]|uniref:hypothetical protein n=1 Tax=Bacillus cereus TaxID=1396 RepID=UPI00192DB9FB|nr:hypothetical protein [Bacillus cereus]